MKKRARIGNKTWEYESDDPVDVAFIERKLAWHNTQLQKDNPEHSYVGSVDFSGNYPISKEAGDISHVFIDSNDDDDGWDGYKLKLRRGRQTKVM